MSHTCHAFRCEVEVPPKLFMCLKHWRMVPRKMQAAIWGAYVPGQERRKDPSIAYLNAAMAAVNYVKQKEGL